MVAPSAQHKILCSVDTGLYLSRNDVNTAAGNTVGLGVIAPSVLQAVIPEHPMADPRHALQWWDALIGELAQHVSAAHLELISNGSGVDRSEEHTSELQSLMRISYSASGLTRNIQHIKT